MKITEQEINQNEISTGFRVFEIVRKIAVYLLSLIIVIGAMFFAADKSPNKSLFGFRYYTVLTPSMEPEFSAGDMVFVKIMSADNINVGDVITFNPSSGGEAYLTHRVVEKLVDYQGSGVTCFRTKGDANDTKDSFLIDADRVIGKVEFHVPGLGYVIRFIQLKWYFIIPLVLLLVLFFVLMKRYFQLKQEDAESETAGKDKKTSEQAVQSEAPSSGENANEKTI